METFKRLINMQDVIRPCRWKIFKKLIDTRHVSVTSLTLTLMMAKRQMPGTVYLLVNENFLDANSITRVVYALVKTNLSVCSAFIHALTKIFSYKNVYTKSKYFLCN